MSKVLMVTKTDCSHCSQLKMFLEMAMDNKYKEDIEIVHETDNKEKYEELKEKFNIQSAPALIFEDEIMRNYSPMATIEFLEKHVGTK